MVEHFITFRDSLTLFNDAHPDEISLPTPGQWTLLGDLLKLQKPLEKLTLRLQRKDAFASIIIPSVLGLKKQLALMSDLPGLKTTVKQLESSLVKRFNTAEDNNLLAAATLLDPRFKDKGGLLSSSTVNRLQEHFSNEEETSTSDTSKNGESSPPRKKQHADDGDDLFAFLGELDDEPAPTSCVTVELATYKQEALVGMQEDPLQWWQTNRHRFPRLAALARRYLSAPATSVDSERTFSVSGSICSEKRSRLSPERLEHLVFLNVNLRQFSFCRH